MNLPVGFGLVATACALLFAPEAVARVPRQDEDGIPSSPFVRNRNTDGYVAFDTASRVYRRPDGTGPVVSLVGVVHIGDRRYYDELVGILGQSEIVLYESVLPRGAFGTRGRDDLERQRRTQEAMLFVRGLAERFERANGRVPASLAELRAFTVSRDTRLARPFDLACVDGWGRRIGYATAGLAEAPAYCLFSLGSDGAPGGRDTALDLSLPRLAPRPVQRPNDSEATSARDASAKKEGRARDERRDLYKELADALGVSLQVRSIDYDRPGWEPADLPMEELLDRLWKRGERSVTLEMLSKQDGFAQGVMRFFLSMVSESPQFKKLVIQALGGGGEMAAGGRRDARPLGDVDSRIIIDERNDAVIDELAHLLSRPEPPKSVAIFYGAAHMGDFEETLRERWGLEPAEVIWSCAMGADDWSEKKIRERIALLEDARQALLDHDPQGYNPSASRLEWRLGELRRRLDVKTKPQS